MNKTISKHQLKGAIWASILILFSGHALQSVYEYFNFLLIIIATLGFFFLFPDLMKKRSDLLQRAFIIFIVMVALTAIKDLGRGIGSYIIFASVIIIAMWIVKIFSFDEVRDAFLSVMTFTTCVALVGYFLVNNTEFLSFLPTVTNANGVEYGMGIVFNYIKTVPERNCGMFWEPGIFATFLAVSIVFEVLLKRTKANIFHVVLFSIGIITANSAAGFALLPFCLLLFLSKSKKDKWLYYFGAGIAAFLVLLLPIVLLNLDSIIQNSFLGDNEYIQKLLTENLKEQSRLRAITHNISVFLDNPFLGAGIRGAEGQIAHVSDTSTSTYLMSVYGILGASYTIFWIIGVFRQKNLNLITKLLVLLIFFIIVNNKKG